jgi:hypothetical protein
VGGAPRGARAARANNAEEQAARAGRASGVAGEAACGRPGTLHGGAVADRGQDYWRPTAMVMRERDLPSQPRASNRASIGDPYAMERDEEED